VNVLVRRILGSVALPREQVAAALPSYEIGEELGRGATGVVLAARHRQLGRDVALKILPPELAENAEVRRRFLAEAKLLASFSHVHIVAVFDFVEQEGLCLLVMERLKGGTLHSYARAGIDAHASCAAVLALCSALHYAHERGVLHRDVKPSNVLIAEDGMVKVTDFGIAKVLGGAETLVTRSGFVLGTPAYMAPEQAEETSPGPATDVYGAGTVLYELLAGRLPFDPESTPLQMLYSHVHSDPHPLLDHAPDVPPDLAAVVMKALERDPIRRYRSANDFGVAIAGAAASAWGSGWLSQAPFTFAAAGAILTAASAERPVLPTPVEAPAPKTLVDAAPDDIDFEARQLVPIGDVAEPAPGPLPPPPAPPAPEPEPEPAGDPSPPPQRSGSRRPLIVAAVVAAIALAGGAIALLSGGDDKPAKTTAATTPVTPPPPTATVPVDSLDWKKVPDMLAPARQQMGGAVFGDSAWLIGGLRDSPEGAVASDQVERFDPTINSWGLGPKLPVALHHDMAVAYDGQLLTLGGWTPEGRNLTANVSNRVYSLVGSRWIDWPSMPTARAAGAAGVVDGKVVVVGGQGADSLVTATDIYDGKRWVQGAPIPTPREHLGAASDGRYLYAVGGRSEGKNLNTVERYDPRTDTWAELPHMRTKRNGVGVAIVGGQLYAVGGETSYEVLRNVEIYDIARRSWSNAPPLPQARHGMVVVALRGAIYALGGALGVDHTKTTPIATTLDLRKP
jgi:N-acetylneuraminic acid mutarotase